jgi:hypothetical protein
MQSLTNEQLISALNSHYSISCACSDAIDAAILKENNRTYPDWPREDKLSKLYILQKQWNDNGKIMKRTIEHVTETSE